MSNDASLSETLDLALELVAAQCGLTLSRMPDEAPALRIEDAPRFAYRGLHLDVARHFFPVEFVKKYIDLLVMYKFNRFHWHLAEVAWTPQPLRSYDDFVLRMRQHLKRLKAMGVNARDGEY